MTVARAVRVNEYPPPLQNIYENQYPTSKSTHPYLKIKENEILPLYTRSLAIYRKLSSVNLKNLLHLLALSIFAPHSSWKKKKNEENSSRDLTRREGRARASLADWIQAAARAKISP